MRERSDDLTIDDYRKLADLRHLIRRYLRTSEQIARAAGIEPQQYQALLAIKGLPEGTTPSVGEIANRLQIQHHSAVELISRLADRGLVDRRRGDIDRRRVLVRLTDQGEAVLRDLARYHRAELEAIGPAVVRDLSDLLGRDLLGGDARVSDALEATRALLENRTTDERGVG